LIEFVTGEEGERPTQFTVEAIETMAFSCSGRMNGMMIRIRSDTPCAQGAAKQRACSTSAEITSHVKKVHDLLFSGAR
jgi:hypothetical protein